MKRRSKRKPDAARESAPLYQPRDYARALTEAAPNDEPYRSEFRRDYARLIHSASFRRLVGKTQLFPCIESDFFRNRLTHSLEVAQIAKSIATKINLEQVFSEDQKIDTDLVELAGLAHDLGHPPFGHNGEQALHAKMAETGGFEGNAQTLRILARLEKKATSDPDGCGVTTTGDDQRYGLNLCARSLAAVLKYDNQISYGTAKFDKGYYESELGLVRWIKSKLGVSHAGSAALRTIESEVMDLADDIAYSTYDIEDAFKGGFLTPLDFMAADNASIDEVVRMIREKDRIEVDREDVRGVLLLTVSEVLNDQVLRDAVIRRRGRVTYDEITEGLARIYRQSAQHGEWGYLRTRFTSQLVKRFISGVKFSNNTESPALSKVSLTPKIHLQVTVLKRFAFVSLIMSPRLKITEVRAGQIVARIFDELSKSGNYRLMPEDYRSWYSRLPEGRERTRVACDFIAGMTDRYAVEYYCRLTAESPESIYKRF